MKYIILALVIGVLGFFILQGVLSVPMGSMELNRFSSSTSTTVTIAQNVGTSVLSADSGRKWARIDNNGTTTIYCILGTLSAEDGIGIRIDTGEYFVIDPSNLYVGEVYCIGPTSPSAVGVTSE